MTDDTGRFRVFTDTQLQHVNGAVSMAEELVSNHYKMSSSQWLRGKYDIRTVRDLERHEIVQGPFAQVIRYEGQRRDSSLGSSSYSFYKICLQDHNILRALERRQPDLRLQPFCLYIVVHELIHVVRFSKFLQSFDASPAQMLAEESRVHRLTHRLLAPLSIEGIHEILDFYDQWCEPVDGLSAH